MPMTQAERDAEDATNLTLAIAGRGKSYRDERIYEGITVNGVSISTDDKTQLRLAGARIEAEADDTYTVKWKTSNGFVTLNATQVIALSSAVRAHIQKCFDAQEAIEDQTFTSISALETAFDNAYQSA